MYVTKRGAEGCVGMCFYTKPRRKLVLVFHEVNLRVAEVSQSRQGREISKRPALTQPPTVVQRAGT